MTAVICSCAGMHPTTRPRGTRPNGAPRETRLDPIASIERPAPRSNPASDAVAPRRVGSATADTVTTRCAHAGAVLYGVRYGRDCTSSVVAPRGDSLFAAAIATIARGRHSYCERIYQAIQNLLHARRVYWFDEPTEPMLIGITQPAVFVGINRRAPNLAEAIRHEAAHAAGFMGEADATYMAAFCWGWAT